MNQEYSADYIARQLVEIDEFMQTLTKSQLKSYEFSIYGSIMELYEMCQKYKQYDIPEMNEKGYARVKKIIKVRRYLDYSVLKRWEIDHCVSQGLWVAVEGIMISPDVMDDYFRGVDSGKKLKRLIKPEEDIDYPEDIHWGTIKRLPNGYGFALKKEGLVPHDIFTSYQWEYLTL